ncbi:MAG: single-stranded DNA-binding protein [Chloroflexi bacterium]|nr:single-stranded DNA-binding protein [Chloroflexota bacterium]
MGFNINHITLSGNLTRDPELRATPGGTSVCSLRIANNTRRKDSSGEWIDKPNYFNVTVWAGQGEWIASNISKGARVVVSGRMEWREWEAKDGSGKRQSYDVIADDIVTVGEGSGGSSSQPDVPADTSGLPTGGPPLSAGPPDDDIPFAKPPWPDPENEHHWRSRPTWPLRA